MPNLPQLPPRHLRQGDLIGVVAPSSPVAHFVPRRLERGLRELERLGFGVRLGAHATARLGHTAGTVGQRCDDLHAMFADPQVKGIITTIGGFNAHQLLDELDYDLIRSNPKVLMGYSDITALHLGIYARTGLVTFLGPALLPQFAEAGGLHPYSRASFEQVVCRPEPAGLLRPAGEAVVERLRWDQEDDRPRRTQPHPGPQPLRPGRARGPIVAGNAGTMLLLAGTPYWPDLDGAILCLEDDEEEKPATFDRHFTQLRQMGVFGRIAGLIVGRVPPEVGFSEQDSLADLVLQATRGYDFPIGLDFDFGHWDPICVLPIGVEAELTVTENAQLTLLAPAVS